MPLREAAVRSISGRACGAKRGVRPDGIVEPDVAADADAGFGDEGVGVEIHLLVLHRAPEALYEYVVAPAALAIHADGDLLAVEDVGERRAGELRALVAVEDVRFAMPRQRFFQRLDAEPGIKRDRHPPRQHPPGEPVDDGDEVDEAARHWDVGDVGSR